MMIFIIPSWAAAQQPFIELLDLQNVTLTQEESDKFNAFDPNDTTFTKQVIRLHPIENYLQGRSLTIQLPNSLTSVALTTDYGYSKINGEYYWAGYDEDGNHLKIGKHATGLLGDLYVAASDTKYVFVGLSSDKTAMLTYANWKKREATMHCGNDDDADDPEEEAADEESEEEIEFRDGCENNLIRVLVLFTAGAATNGFPPATVAANLIAELNMTASASGLPTGDIRFALANTVFLQGFIEFPDDPDGDVDALADDLIAQDLRDDNFADVVILLTDNVYIGIAGIARAIRASNGKAYCLAEINAVALNFTGSHEIGHVIGTRHQRCQPFCATGCDDMPTTNHGFIIGGSRRTIMHSNGCGGTRVGRWSSKSAKFMGLDTGNSFNNNAKRLKNRAKKVSCFRTGIPIINEPPHPDLFYIDGSVQVCENQLPPAYKIIFNENTFPNAQFVWETSPNGLTSWSVPNGLINNGAECILPSLYTLPDLIFLRVTITGSNGQIDSDILMITKLGSMEGICVNGGSPLVQATGGGFMEAGALSPKSTLYAATEVASLRIFPNPNKGTLILDGLAPNAQLFIIDVNGSQIYTATKSEYEHLYSIDIAHLPAGVYFLKAQENTSITIKKIIKQ